MCGILGIVDNKGLNEDSLTQARDTMFHRGPDSSGIWINSDRTVGLAHRRLSVIDLSEAGMQPMSDGEGKIWIAYNGEIYNFQDIRKELDQRGYIFRSRTDTEVIINAYKEWGTDCLHKFNGMFAFCIYDMNQFVLFLARDRLGKKPVYYHFDGRRFAFSSELKALRKLHKLSFDIDYTSIAKYMIYGYIPSPHSIYTKISKLRPAHFLIVDLRGDPFGISDQKRYWTLEYQPDYSKSEVEWVEELEDTLLNAVKIRMISDVPLGAFLSGGIDSGLVVSMMARVSNLPVKTFTIGFREKAFDESGDAQYLAELIGTEHNKKIVDLDTLRVLPLLASQYDEPFADSSAIPTFYVSRFAKEKVTVVLSGDGGDEAFCGYGGTYQRFLRLKAIGLIIPDVMKRKLFPIIAGKYPQGLKGAGFLKRLQFTDIELYSHIIGDPDAVGLLGEEVLTKAQTERLNPFSEAWEAVRDRRDISKMMYTDTMNYLPDDVLTKVDRASMLNSLEVRSPLLDYHIYELAARIPLELKLRKGEKKYILKRLASKYMPAWYLNKAKKGFRVPIGLWLKRDPMYMVDSLKNSHLFAKEKVSYLINQHMKGNRDLSTTIWKLIMLSEWWKVYG